MTERRRFSITFWVAFSVGVALGYGVGADVPVVLFVGSALAFSWLSVMRSQGKVEGR